ncbi:MAG: response regulator [Parcubacteria group bacterium]|nr:response regulator [Parcubacteria group bacterium]
MQRKKTKKKILIVEDEAPLRAVLRDNLEYEGFDIHEASDGKEGISVAAKERPDLILLDILMPEMDGLTMLEEIRKKRWGRAVPVMLLTNLSADRKVIRGLVEHTPVYYFDKSGRTVGEIVTKVKARLEF